MRHLRLGGGAGKRRSVVGLMVAVVAVVVAVVVPSLGQAVVPGDGGSLTVLPVAINTSPGDQFDPHVSGDIAAYTSGDTIRYYNFFTGVDALVPTETNVSDQLSGVSGTKIVFSRLDLTSFRQSILVFDTGTAATTEVDPITMPYRTNASIGASTVAFIDFGLAPSGELAASRLGDGLDATRITTDTRYDEQPTVAPSGNLIVWESCESTASNCDIHQAASSGSAWTTIALTTTSEPEANPDTDGTVVVYDAIRSGEKDIFWQPVGGGAEQQLQLAGEQRNPSVSNGVILFESIAVGAQTADIYAYEIATNRLFRITTTPTDDNLNDISAIGGSSFHIVWTAGDQPARDVYGATFTIPPAGPTYTFGGFLQPVDPLPTLNSMKAGAAVPVKFSLGGNQGLNIFQTAYPKSQQIVCNNSTPIDPIEQTTTAGQSGLTYDPTTGIYTYVWKTDKAWANSCRQLILSFTNGSTYRANFTFK